MQPGPFLHLINPVTVADPSSDLHAAQPVTIAAISDARAFAAASGSAAVHLAAVMFPEDRAALPAGFELLPDLERSVLDTSRFQTSRKLPLIGDLISRAVDAADRVGADWIIYSNVDIAPMPDFYSAIAALLARGYDAFSINRRTIRADWPGGVSDLPLMRAEVGTPHPGRDCFVFAREAARAFDCGDACVGADFVGKVLAANAVRHSRRYADLQDLHLTFHLGDDRRWLSPEHQEYSEHNRRELASVLGRLRSIGEEPAHPVWKELIRRFSDPR